MDLGCGAHLQQLRRTKSGRFNLDRSITVDEISTAPVETIRSKVLSLAEVSRFRGA
jgi:tRNA pseudouridine55 synthase